MKMMPSLEETKMENGNGNGNGAATEKQVAALKSLAKNPALSQGLLKGVEFGSLGKKEASDLLGKCFAVADNAGFVNGGVPDQVRPEFQERQRDFQDWIPDGFRA